MGLIRDVVLIASFIRTSLRLLKQISMTSTGVREKSVLQLIRCGLYTMKLIPCLRYYAWINKVYSPGFKVQFTWLNYSTFNGQDGIRWNGNGLPVACGNFVYGETVDTTAIDTFSHRIEWAKRTKKALTIYILEKVKLGLFSRIGMLNGILIQPTIGSTTMNMLKFFQIIKRNQVLKLHICLRLKDM